MALDIVDQRLQLLIERHQYLDDQVDKMSAQRYLIPGDRDKLKELKIMRLTAKRSIDYFLTTRN
jgi:hypothetical protein